MIEQEEMKVNILQEKKIKQREKKTEKKGVSSCTRFLMQIVNPDA